MHLPGPLMGHCQVQLNATCTMLFGGTSRNQPSNRTWIFNWDTQYWKQMESMSEPSKEVICAVVPETTLVLVIENEKQLYNNIRFTLFPTYPERQSELYDFSDGTYLPVGCCTNIFKLLMT